MLSLTLRATTTLTCSLHSSGYLSVCNRDGFMMQYCKSGMWGAGLYFAEKASCECLRLKCCSSTAVCMRPVLCSWALHCCTLYHWPFAISHAWALRRRLCLQTPMITATDAPTVCLDTTQQQAEALHPRHSVFCFVNNVTCVDTTGLFCFVCVRTCR